MSALPIEVTPDQPPSQGVWLLGQYVPTGPADAVLSVAFLVGTWADGSAVALRGVPSVCPITPTAPIGFISYAIVRLSANQAWVQARDIERVDP